MKKNFLLCVLFNCCIADVFAQPSLLDPTFGVNGIVTTDMGLPFAYTNFGKQVLLQPDGSIYLVFEGAGSTLIAKKLFDGSPDLTYGKNGFSVPTAVHKAHAAIQADGKIVIAGFVDNPDYYNNPTDFGVARFNTDGSLDNSFDGDGIVVTDLGSQDIISALTIQNDGKILVAGLKGFAPYFDVTEIALARYNTDGSLDQGFGTNGRVTSRFAMQQYANSVGVQSDGKIVVEGSIDIGAILARYNSDGTPDLTFSSTGYKDINFGSQSGPHSIIVQSDDKILAGSSISNGSDLDFQVARFNADGSPDNTFNGDGFQTTDFGGAGDTLSSILLQSDGKIVVAGYTLEEGNTNFAIARYNTDGSPDNSFDGDGKKTLDFGGANDYAIGLAVQNDGKIITTGYSVSGPNTYLAAARLNGDGSPDNSFDTDGMLVDHVIQGDTHYTSSVIQSDGKILAAGSTWNGINYDFAVARYNTDGSLDVSFSGDGKATTGFATTNDYATSIALQPDGKIVVAGSAGDHFGVARYNSDGTPDNSFDGDGVITANNIGQDFINALAIQGDGKILVGGSSLARFNTDGSPDLTFNGTGRLPISFSCNSLALQNDGKIIVGGNNSSDGFVARYNIDGSTDGTFGLDGIQDIFAGGDGNYWLGKSVAIQNDGKIILGGSYVESYRTMFSRFFLLRLNPDGSYDNTFSTDGYAYANPGLSNLDYGNAVFIQPDNKIIIAGSSYNKSNYDFALARFNADGTLDNTFSGDGIEITGASTASSEAAAIAFSNDNLYAAGYGQYPGNFGVVAKYLVASGGPLPLALIDFTGALKNNSVLLQWQTASEHNLSKFSVERSFDGIKFSGIGDVAAKGNSNTKLNYSTLDRQPVQGRNFYRLKMFDADGQFTYSTIVQVNISGHLFTLSIYPNPASRILFVQAYGENEKATFRIMDAGGRIVNERKVTLNGNISFPIDITTLAKGTYYLQLNRKIKSETRTFVKE